MGRAPCCSKVGLHRGPWTAREDALLIKYIEAHGEGQWRSLPKKAGLLRCGKSCRLRWMNYLRPDIKRGNITSDEEDLIIRLHGLLGNRWSLIAGRLPGRTDNEIKNYWNTHLSKRLRSQGTDPNTHKKLSESELEKSANLSKKKGRSSTTSHANKGKSSRKTNHQLHKKYAFKNDSNGSEERERTKIHLPKPVRVTSIMPMTRCNSNGSFETNASTTTACSRQSDQPQNHGIMLDQENPMLDMSWPLHHDDHAIIMDDGDHGLDHLMMMDVFQPHHENHHHHDHDHDHDYDHHELAPSDDAVQLEKLYEEYLQLIKTDHDHDGDGYCDVDVDGHDDDDDEGAQLDSLTEYFLI